MVSNGYVNQEPLRDLLPLIDAWNIDLKSIRPEFYKRLAGGRLEPVLETIEAVNKTASLELTNLVIPGENDSDADLRDLVDWIANLDSSIPLHFSRYHPDYKMKNPSTPVETLQKAYRIGIEKLQFVYVGNAHIPGTLDTFCPECKETIVKRSGFRAQILALKDGACAHCGRRINIVH
jgi:pyruvate formate lyase activating enzyme